MAPTTWHSQADDGLIAAAAGAGVAISPRQLKRWRLVGVLPSPTRRGLGRGRGTTSTYPPGTLERLLVVAQLPRRARTGGSATLALFAMGIPVEESALKRAHAEWAHSAELDLRRALQSADPSDVAAAAAHRMLGPFVRTPLGRRCLRRLRRPGESARAELLSVLREVVSVMLTGRPSSPDGLERWLDAIGVSRGLERLGHSPRRVVGEFLADPFAVRLLGALSLPGLAQAFSSASLEELSRARQDLVAAVTWLTGPGLDGLRISSLVGPLVEEVLDPATVPTLARDWINGAAIGVPLVVTVRRLLGGELDRFAAWVASQTGPPAARVA